MALILVLGNVVVFIQIIIHYTVLIKYFRDLLFYLSYKFISHFLFVIYSFWLQK